MLFTGRETYKKKIHAISSNTKNCKIIKVPSIHGQTSLVLSKPIILSARYSKYPNDYKTISIFWCLIFPNPGMMVHKLWKVKDLVFIKVVLTVPNNSYHF